MKRHAAVMQLLFVRVVQQLVVRASLSAPASLTFSSSLFLLKCFGLMVPNQLFSLPNVWDDAATSVSHPRTWQPGSSCHSTFDFLRWSHIELHSVYFMFYTCLLINGVLSGQKYSLTSKCIVTLKTVWLLQILEWILSVLKYSVTLHYIICI